tara:strand:+ start:151 stop:438 length:288 start_codon:yes stop_codon:yes gene_type:complete
MKITYKTLSAQQVVDILANFMKLKAALTANMVQAPKGTGAGKRKFHGYIGSFKGKTYRATGAVDTYGGKAYRVSYALDVKTEGSWTRLREGVYPS